jgi:hypothetical protein
MLLVSFSLHFTHQTSGCRMLTRKHTGQDSAYAKWAYAHSPELPAVKSGAESIGCVINPDWQCLRGWGCTCAQLMYIFQGLLKYIVTMATWTGQLAFCGVISQNLIPGCRLGGRTPGTSACSYTLTILVSAIK